MRISLAPSFTPIKAEGTAKPGLPLLDPAGARVILGSDAGALAAPITPTPHQLFGPRGVCVHPDGSLWVADTGHHRLLGWRQIPEADDTPADILLGQPEFGREGRNAKGKVTATTLNVPTGLAAYRGGLALADAWNHRVMIWRRPPEGPGHAADIILGQTEPHAAHANRGDNAPGPATLNWPYGVAEIGGRLVVCDTGNRRVLIWNDPRETGQAADLVLGQTDFFCRDENAGGPVSARSMRWPHAAVGWNRGLAVADAGNNRVMLWHAFPDANGEPADAVLGQADLTACDLNCGGYYPTAAAVNMPYALALLGGRLVVGDTANSRLIGFSCAHTGAEADRLTGQPDYATKGDNRWGLPARDSLCWPYGLSPGRDFLAIADSGNNRVLLWGAA